ncbi:unnamed protein product [Effrenium voratum]|uniref:Uncharacterized protein n=1 Tax=Effrenium voratum TaxID=2562239 RepID=A0AA36NC91_9DINO|nr:unnamed protein product [Effrenium voratum]CAJ1407090.1 unnamed protein product [Effrenium voratum]CAJ1414115.1 unnamed protein product [Effrenium voratum]
MLCCAKKPVEKEPQVDVEGKLKELEERLSLKIQETQGSVTNNYSVDLTQLKEQFLARFKALEQALDQSVERHTQQLHELRQELTTHSEKHSESLGELRESSTVEVQALRSEFSERLETHHSELRQVDEKHMASVQELSQAAQAAQDRSERLHQESSRPAMPPWRRKRWSCTRRSR